ncbi:HAMP domain-containing protein [Mesorhizobium sp. M3A.F.Ca.ET.174.01.1.1]|uniref:ATP-binding protein n=1 Tax=unclassified Mesorhizobium TaxID=325217 RepID=UPI0010935241|nr:MULTISPECIES: ATP-binding protein [unclassified Mesorhizobium]TGS71506.1 HAMP domain-containing protein [Mesorhizobium sp. M3A.F.Ca.ET.201.01.1.1]TGS82367.1 HAMP domain-containing protein [Mesorhizobium sp. M3A.F.Ca.ET.175.01.1.1]TGT22189.1 HAMP domain-containing protein [Mesorhizobium sp. M3A.F.Ca.ET.174.01.1.1]
MTSLRRRLIILLVVSILGVVGLATFVAVKVLGGPSPELTMGPLAHQIQYMVQLVPGHVPGSGAAPVTISDRPAPGFEDRKHTRVLNDMLRQNGLDVSAVVSRNAGQPGMIASVALPDHRFMIVNVPDLGPPRDVWYVFAGWMALIVLGATPVSIYFTGVLVRPLEMLEAAVSKIGSDGVLATLPEKGPVEVRATAHALNELSARLRTAMESRMRLVAAAGHDLRTPMTRMRLRAEFLEEDREKWLSDLDELDRIADSAIRLVREEVNQDAVEPVALDTLVRDIEVEMVSLGHAVTIDHLDHVSVNAGALGLRRALRNLIVNAATHGKNCTVSLSGQGNRAVLTIGDRGPGIPPDLLNKAFEPFFRVDPARMQFIPGAGLGLAIAKEIIERYGGSIRLENRQGGGLVQTIIFPRE